MTAQAADRPKTTKAIRYIEKTLESGYIAYKNAQAMLNPADNTVRPMAAVPGRIPLGRFLRGKDATDAAQTVTIDLGEECEAEYFANATAGDAIASTDIGKSAWFKDDQTVAITPDGKLFAGEILEVSSTLGVLVRRVKPSCELAKQGPALSYTSNDASPSDIIHGAVYDVPTTGAASTITLPAAAQDGTVAHFVADGTKNGHTVQFRDATGPTNLTTALTASKRFLVTAAKLDGKWFANAYLSP